MSASASAECPVLFLELEQARAGLELVEVLQEASNARDGSPDKLTRHGMMKPKGQDSRSDSRGRASAYREGAAPAERHETSDSRVETINTEWVVGREGVCMVIGLGCKVDDTVNVGQVLKRIRGIALCDNA